ncbi:MAG: aminotransferase class I/II-fold pyridoxal phosphate-dependent enzyme [Lentisphaerae bacterium]|nr:aminotransferase class I/II-fold pyridoxal phosphate-dependent enzyme [Lentisphaerota bacterium]
MNYLSVFYLHAAPLNAESHQKLTNGLSDIFRSFCCETFPSEEPIDWPPLKIIAVQSPQELSDSLLLPDRQDGMLTDDGQNCILFLLDDVFSVAGAEAAKAPLHTLTLDNMPLTQWLYTFFPAIPKIVLTTPGAERVRVPSRRWVLKPRAVFDSVETHIPRIRHLFRALWEPRFWHALRHYVMDQAGTSWHTPGHNAGHAFSRSLFLQGFRQEYGTMTFRADLSVSVHSLGDLSKPESRTSLADAQRLTSEIFGSAQSCYITNGSTTANKAMLMTLLRPGETVLLDRNCHKSVHHAVVMAGAVPNYLPARFNTELGVWGPVAMSDIRQALAAHYADHDKPRMLILTTCTYEGVLYPVWEIARLCERHGMLFYADEAWAPYLSFHPFYMATAANGKSFRYNAIHETTSAHFAVHSTHKTLAAFSQASMIHVSFRFKQLFESEAADWQWLHERFAINGRGAYDKFTHDLHEVLRYWHSTSPHYPMMATLDCAGVQMRIEGMRLIEERLRWVSAFKQRVSQACGLPENECFPGLEEIAGKAAAQEYVNEGYMHDPLKMLLSFKNADACLKFKKLLRASKIQWEKSTPVTILFLVTMGTVEEHFGYLYRAIMQFKEYLGLPERSAFSVDVADAVNGQAVALPRDAALCDGELLELSQTEGRVCSQLLVPYPPGIPVFMPGLMITRAMIDLVRNVADSEGPDAVHGLFVRGHQYFVEVVRHDEEKKIQWLPTGCRPTVTS